MSHSVVVRLERDEAIALEAEAKITIEGVDRLTDPSACALRSRERLVRAHAKLRAILDTQDGKTRREQGHL